MNLHTATLPATRGLGGRAREALRSELRQPVLRGAYTLLFNTAATAALGLAFWIASARLLPVATVGAGTATISFIVAAANLGQLNLYQSAGVLLAGAGDARRALAQRILRLAAGATFLVASAAVALAAITGNQDNLAAPVWMIVGFAMAWTVFAVKDGLLVGLRRFSAIPAANTAYGVLKVLAVVGLAAVLPDHALVLATFVPALLIAPVVLTLVLTRLPQPTHPVGRVRLGTRFIGLDYTASLFLQASTTLLPFLVLLGAGAEAAGVFAVIWMTIAMLDMVAHNVGVPLASEAARDPGSGASLERAVRLRALVVVTVAALGVAFLAGPLLAVFGPVYVESGVLTLQLMVLGLIPRAYSVIAFARLRGLRRSGVIAALEAGHAVVVVSGCLLLLPQHGLVSVGIVWIFAQMLLAAACAIVRRCETEVGGDQ